ncbi:MAG: hypothetical protein QF681_00920 [Vicinamibacterales bacterium]|jgi:hypothetical protein|nr:hypothetical protein [Vicinamibacterales bacterium]MQG67216.1 hypothetical protein [SAR202 cluster bacterium]
MLPEPSMFRLLLVVTSLALAASPSLVGAQPSSAEGDPAQASVAPTLPGGVAGVPDPRELVATTDVVTRDDRGGTTIRAIKLTAGILLDGLLAEPVYRTVSAITGLIQLMPEEGAPA